MTTDANKPKFILHIKTSIVNYLTKGHQRSVEAKKNIAASLLIKGISIINNLALVPLTIHYVSSTQYGIWITLSSIIAWFSFFDIGFGNGLRNRFAEAKATNDIKKAQVYVSTTYAVLSIIFIIVWLLFSFANYFIDWSNILNAPKSMASELSTLAILVFSFLCINIILKTIDTIIIADQKPALAGFLNMLGQLLSLIIILVLVHTTQGSLLKLGIAIGLAPIIVYIITSVFFFNGKYQRYSPTIENIDFSFAKDIMSLGIKFFLIQFGALILFQTTNIVIAQTLGPEKVTVYNIAFKYFSVLSMLFYIFLSPFWSAFTEAYTKKDFEWMVQTMEKLKKIWLLSIPLGIIMLYFANYAYKLWVGNAVVIPMSVSILTVILVLSSMRFNLFIFLINGVGKIYLQLCINIFISVIYIPMAIYSCIWMGLIGIIGANIIVALIYAIVSQIQITKIVGNDASGIWDK